MMRRFLTWLSARLPVHRDGHLYNADLSLYMGRWILFDLSRLHARLHYVASNDPDRDLHDHPSDFVSAVLCGEYTEARPVTVDPCFVHGWREQVYLTVRRAGSVAFRRATDRHKIISVVPGTWTLFVFVGGRHQWWGYYTPAGKVWWRDYLRRNPDARRDV